MVEVLDGVEGSETVVPHDTIVAANLDYQAVVGETHILHVRLVTLTSGVSFAMVESASGEGIKVWRPLVRKHDSRTHTRWVQLLLGIINFKIPKMEDVLSGMAP